MTYILAEIGANHNGDMALAKKMITEAYNCGCNAVKFQSWDKSMWADEFLTDNPKLRQKIEQYSLDFSQLALLSHFAKETGIEFICTLSDENKEIPSIVEFIKIASMDVNNIPLLKFTATQGKPVLLSVGMSTDKEITNAYKTLKGKRPVTPLHCVSLYPPKDNQANLGRIEHLRKLLKSPVGYSDHTIGATACLSAVALGAVCIEKHFTLDKNMEGWDHAISADPMEMSYIVRQSKRISEMLKKSKMPDKDTRNVMRRSIVAGRDYGRSEKIDKLDYKRPGTGIPPDKYSWILGRKARHDIKKGTMLKLRDLI